MADKNQEDPVIRDAWSTLGYKFKRDVAEVFGEENFLPVMRNQVNDAIGYRTASLTDVWTGITRWSPNAQESFRDLYTTILGKDAFTILAKGQSGLQDMVSWAKTTIIVRSMKVMWQNILSNGLHLSLRGIDPITMAKQGRKKFIEITQYVRNREETLRLELDLANATGPAEIRRLEARIRAIEEENDRMTIKPLLDAGEFSTISEGLDEHDVAMREGKWAEWLEKSVEKLPGWGPTVAKNALVTKDTALFKGLNRAVQYGDFVAKAILYDHLVQKKGMEPATALDEIMEEFVQYNRLPGRGRDFLESNGLLWFWNYKLRIQKIAIKMIRERPLSALMMGGVGPTADIDSVMSGSLAGTVAWATRWGLGWASTRGPSTPGSVCPHFGVRRGGLIPCVS